MALKKAVREFWPFVGVALLESFLLGVFAMFVLGRESLAAFGGTEGPFFADWTPVGAA